MALTTAELARRVACELESTTRVWLSPALDAAFFQALPPTVKVVDTHAEISVVVATELSARGDVRADPAPKAMRTMAVLTPDAAIVRQLGHGLRVERVFSELGVVDVTPQGLVLVELAPGVSATDFQKRAEPTLRISPRLTEVAVDSLDERRTEQ